MTDTPAPVSRLSPCPCGSGKRYRDCHGALTGAPASAAPQTSTYRPSGPDWDQVPESGRNRLGALMEAALVHQREGRAREAERCYREVLADAPSTHDALHMLAMVRWRKGDFPEARRLIEQAIPLRAEYAAIRQNLMVVISAQMADEANTREAACEKELPSTFESRASKGGPDGGVRAPAQDEGNATIHLIGVDDDFDGDDAWMLRRLAAVLAPLSPVVWSACRSDAPVWDGIVANADSPEIPRGGVRVFVGVGADFGAWLSRAKPLRTVVFPQSAPPSWWLDALRAIVTFGVVTPELVAESRAKAARFGQGHSVLPPPIDLGEATAVDGDVPHRDAFVIGSVVQDGHTVALSGAGSLLKALAARRFELDVYDPGRARSILGAAPNVRCVSRRQVSLAQFLAPLSCYLYRFEAWWKEGSGRDLFGAMALGIPVVCPRGSIYAEYLDDGIDGFLVDDAAGALECLAALRDDPARVAAIGRAARATARRLFDPATLTAAYRRAIEGTVAEA